MRLIQISDTHIFAGKDEKLQGVDSRKNLEAVLTRIEKSEVPPDIIVLTGNLAEDASESAYQYIAGIFGRFSCPVYWVPGNHDAPDKMQKVFSSGWLREDKAVLLGKWLLILLNTHCPGQERGMLGRSELSRLQYFLSEHPDQHAMIVMHHSPVFVGSKWLDTSRLVNAEDFFNITDKYSQIKSIVCGHVHQAFETERNGVKILSAPSTCIQFLPKSDQFALDNSDAGYRVIDLENTGALTSGVERVEVLKREEALELES